MMKFKRRGNDDSNANQKSVQESALAIDPPAEKNQFSLNIDPPKQEKKPAEVQEE